MKTTTAICVALVFSLVSSVYAIYRYETKGHETKVPGTENISIPTPFNPNTATPAATEK